MDTQIRRVRIPNTQNIADFIDKAIFNRRQKNTGTTAITKVRQKTTKELKIQIPENPAASYKLGWRRDA